MEKKGILQDLTNVKISASRGIEGKYRVFFWWGDEMEGTFADEKTGM